MDAGERKAVRIVIPKGDFKDEPRKAREYLPQRRFCRKGKYNSGEPGTEVLALEEVL